MSHFDGAQMDCCTLLAQNDIVVMAKQVGSNGDDYCSLRLNLPSKGSDLIEAAAYTFGREGPVVDLAVFRVRPRSNVVTPSAADERRALRGPRISPRELLDESLEGARFLVVVSRGEWRRAYRTVRARKRERPIASPPLPTKNAAHWAASLLRWITYDAAAKSSSVLDWAAREAHPVRASRKAASNTPRRASARGTSALGSSLAHIARPLLLKEE